MWTTVENLHRLFFVVCHCFSVWAKKKQIHPITKASALQSGLSHVWFSARSELVEAAEDVHLRCRWCQACCCVSCCGTTRTRNLKSRQRTQDCRHRHITTKSLISTVHSLVTSWVSSPWALVSVIMLRQWDQWNVPWSVRLKETKKTGQQSRCGESCNPKVLSEVSLTFGWLPALQVCWQRQCLQRCSGRRSQHCSISCHSRCFHSSPWPTWRYCRNDCWPCETRASYQLSIHRQEPLLMRFNVISGGFTKNVERTIHGHTTAQVLGCMTDDDWLMVKDCEILTNSNCGFSGGQMDRASRFGFRP